MPPLGGYFIERRMSKAPARFAERFESRNDVSLRTSEAGSRTLSRFGVKDEQIYLVIRDRISHPPPLEIGTFGTLFIWYNQMMKTCIEVCGWTGAVMIFTAYALLSFSVLQPTSLTYLILNALGSLGIIIVSYYKQAYPPMVLNIAWVFVAAVGIVRMVLY